MIQNENETNSFQYEILVSNFSNFHLEDLTLKPCKKIENHVVSQNSKAAGSSKYNSLIKNYSITFLSRLLGKQYCSRSKRTITLRKYISIGLDCNYFVNTNNNLSTKSTFVNSFDKGDASYMNFQFSMCFFFKFIGFYHKFFIISKHFHIVYVIKKIRYKKMIIFFYNRTLFDAKLWLWIDDLDTISGAMGPFALKKIYLEMKKKTKDSHYKWSFQCPI